MSSPHSQTYNTPVPFDEVLKCNSSTHTDDIVLRLLQEGQQQEGVVLVPLHRLQKLFSWNE